MIALLQRVSEASVLVHDNPSQEGADGEVSGRIGTGILALVAVEKGDTEAQADRLLQRMLAYRMFEDETGRMNLNLLQAGGQLLLVSQFTLAADTNRGNRPSFTLQQSQQKAGGYLTTCLNLPAVNSGTYPVAVSERI